LPKSEIGLNAFSESDDENIYCLWVESTGKRNEFEVLSHGAPSAQVAAGVETNSSEAVMFPNLRASCLRLARSDLRADPRLLQCKATRVPSESLAP
jgi:hypothetical protein